MPQTQVLVELEFFRSMFDEGTDSMELALLIAALLIMGALIPPRHDLLFWR
jgi:hypothetical protein